MKKVRFISVIVSIIAFNSLAYSQLIPKLKEHIYEICRNPFYQTENLHILAENISNKGNTSDLSLRELYFYTYQEEADLENILKLQQPDGSFKDINYADSALSNWDPTNHALRLLYLSRVYITPTSKYYKQKYVSEYIHKGLNYWFRNKFVCRNWWYNEIGIPRTLGLVFLFIENELSDKERLGAVKVMNNSTFRQTGQNKVWQAGNIFLKALLINDEKLAEQARDTIASEIYQTTNEGIQPDFSFHQHGPQQQFGNYGLAYISSMSYYANVFGETKFAFSDSQIKLLRNYVVEGENYVVWKGSFDVSACNRQLFKQAQVGKNLTFCVAVNLLKKADPTFSTNYNDILQRNLKSGSVSEKPMYKHFWRSDLSIFRNTTDYISVRSCSPRVKGTEFTNKENKKGHYISDGCTIFMRNGDEYADIFPVWDWNHIPGVTAPILDPVVAHTKTDEYKNSNPFVGGLTNGNYGISTFHLTRNKVSAKKSWFYMNGVLICLGANIRSISDKDVITDVNQCRKKSDANVLFSDMKSINCTDTTLSSKDIKAIWQDSIGYYFPKSQQVSFSVKNQYGNWHEIADPYSPEKVSQKIFDLWLNHGMNAHNVPYYEYVVLPSVNLTTLKEFIKQPTFEIISNSKDIQAVKSKASDLIQYVFYKQGKFQTFSPSEFIEAKTLGLIQLERNSEKNISLTVAEPTQSKKTFRISITGKYTADCAKYNRSSGMTEIRIPLPQGSEAGKCKTIQLLKSME